MARPHPQAAIALRPGRADWLAACLVGAMAFLAGLALAGGIAAGQLAARWERGAGSLMLVQVPDPAGASPAGGSRMEAVLQALRQIPGVGRAAPVPATRVNELLKPWLGDVDLGLALPGLVEVTLARPGPDAAALAGVLERAAPGAAAEDQGAHVAPLLAFARGLAALAGGIVLLVAAVATATVGLAVHAALGAHRQDIALLHALGAADGWIARAFARRAARLALYGSVCGGLLALPVLAGLAILSAPLSGGLAGLGESLAVWLPALLVALPAWGMARLAAMLTVRRWLARLW
jgi:cell division transport system permease protein